MKLRFKKIPNGISKKLNSADTYRYFCLSTTNKKDKDYTDSTYKQIAVISKEPERTIGDFVTRLKKSGLISFIEYFEKETEIKRRNKYYLPEPETNFRMISFELLELEIPVYLKGFLIQLFTIASNNTRQVNLSNNKIVQLIKISLPTLRKYVKELLELQLIEITDKGLELPSKYFLINRNFELQKVQKIINNNQIEHFFKGTDWNKIQHPEQFLNSVLGGYRNKKGKVSDEVITI